ncbi:hypothetical protein LPJ66_009298, partial [Kickxella alabastrina]
MKFLCVLATTIALTTTCIQALSAKEKTALTSFDSKYHLGEHTIDELISELSEYTTNADLKNITPLFKTSKTSASESLNKYIKEISKDSEVKMGAAYANKFMMLEQCVD